MEMRDVVVLGGGPAGITFASNLSKLPATDKIDVITLAIQHELTLKELARLSYSAQPWQRFFPAHSAIVEACENALELI